MPEYDVIKTKIFKSNKNYLSERAQRIAEAIALQGGDITEPKRHLISALPNGKQAYFLKPGKETQRAVPNIHDMFPNVGMGDTSETANFTFELIWEYLVKISILNQLTFKKVLVLLYRVCYFIDHQEDGQDKLRYLPSTELFEYIAKIDFALKEGFKDKFKSDEIGVLEFLFFIDLLGWNEDVKYHVKDGQPDFENTTRRNVGRPNTILSVISVPLMINDFLSNIIENVDHVEKINVRLILFTLQRLSKSRGIHVLSHVALQRYLSPYMEQ
jgi:hypothetical protein